MSGHVKEGGSSKHTKVTENDAEIDNAKKSLKIDKNRISSEEEGEISDDETPVLKKKACVLMVGDERLKYINLHQWKNFPTQETCIQEQAKLPEIISLVNKNISDRFNYVLIFALHWDITHLTDTKELKLNEFIDITSSVKFITSSTYKWSKSYPCTKIIWITPHPPDFITYNSLVQNKGTTFASKTIEEHKIYTSKYWTNIELINKKLKDLKDINVFPLNNVLFFKHPHYVRTFTGLSEPKFPHGALYKGLFLTPVTVMYFGHLMSEYLVKLQNKTADEVPTQKSDAKDTQVKDSKIQELRESFEIQCEIYKSNPRLHPKFESSYKKYLKDKGPKTMTWAKYWSQKMEKYFERSWKAKLKALPDACASEHENIDDKQNAKRTCNDEKDNNEKKNKSKLQEDLDCKKEVEPTTDPKHKIPSKCADIKSEITQVTNTTEENPVFSDSSPEKQLLIDESYLSDITEEEKNESLLKSIKDEKFSDTEIYNDKLNECAYNDFVFGDDIDSKVDALVENKSLLEDLDNELKGLFSDEESLDDKDRVKKEEIESEPDNIEDSCDNLNVTTDKVLKIPEESVFFLSVLKMLDCISLRLGYLGSRLSNLYKLAIIKHESGKDPMCIMDEENKMLLAVAYDTLENISKNDDLTLIQKTVISSTKNNLSVLIDKICIIKNSNLLGVNVYNIAHATIGYDTSKIHTFIKNALLYLGHFNVKDVQIMSIYMTVKQIQQKILVSLQD